LLEYNESATSVVLTKEAWSWSSLVCAQHGYTNVEDSVNIPKGESPLQAHTEAS